MTLSAIALGSCTKDDCEPTVETPKELITPALEYVSLSSRTPFTGALIVAACDANSSVYFGNYNKEGQLTPIHAFYTIGDGSIAASVLPVKLPVGEYNLIYWGVPKGTEGDSIYGAVAVNEPAFRIGKDMQDESYSLRKYRQPDTTYYPVFDYVFAVKPIQIGTEKMAAQLQRVTAGLKISLDAKDKGPIDPSIASARVLVSNIATSLDYYTATPSDFSKTISFPLTKSEDGLSMSANSTVMLFPSAQNPDITIVLTLKNGNEKTYRRTLTNAFYAGTRLTLTVTLGEIFSEETSSNGFEVTNWNEQTETITI